MLPSMKLFATAAILVSLSLQQGCGGKKKKKEDNDNDNNNNDNKPKPTVKETGAKQEELLKLIKDPTKNKDAEKILDDKKKPYYLNKLDKHDETLLTQAVKANNLAMVKKLLKMKAKTSVKNKEGKTPKDLVEGDAFKADDHKAVKDAILAAAKAEKAAR